MTESGYKNYYAVFTYTKHKPQGLFAHSPLKRGEKTCGLRGALDAYWLVY